MKLSPRLPWLLLVAAIGFATVGRVFAQAPLEAGRAPHFPTSPQDPQPDASAPNIVVTAIKIVDVNDNPITATAGVPFFVEVDYKYVNPVCTAYTISRAVNGWTNTAAPITLGCGYTGTTSWIQLSGFYWLMYKAGTYPITVTVDSGNAIAESSPSQKTMTTNLVVGGSIIPQWALVDVEFGRTNLSAGTDVIIGTMDDAFDYLDPLYTGNDSLGRPRLIKAVQNSLGVDGSPSNDVHSTACLGIVVARGLDNGDITGLAPDARYVEAEFLNRANLSGLPELDVLDAVNVCLTNGAEVINMPWSYWSGDTTDSETGEAPITDLMADYLMYASNVFCVAYDNELTDPTIPTAPGAARNVITVGGTAADLVHVWSSDDSGPTLDGRCKPDILGGIATNCTTPFWEWRSGFPVEIGFEGNSFAGPFVTGAAAQMIGYAKKHGLNRDHRLLKAIIMNSGVPCLDDNGAAWTNSPTVPMDYQQGTGILNMQRVYGMYSAGQQPSGVSAVPGFDFNTVSGSNAAGAYLLGNSNGVVSYLLGSPSSNSADLDVTMAWDRHTYWTDVNGDGQIDAGDTFYVDTVNDPQNILTLTLFRNGVQVAESISAIDTIQHLHLTNLTPGSYQLNVERLFVPNSANSEPYGLAWYSSVPWTNLPPTVSFVGASLSAGNTASLQFNLESGQAGNFVLQGTASLAPPIKWTPIASTAWSQTGSNTFEVQLPVAAGSPRFFRIGATP
jgi:hypothetical protein